MKHIYTLLACCLIFQFSASAQCTDLFISEYIEGGSNNKALEIFNPTSSAIDLGDYAILRDNNGNTDQTDTFLLEDGYMLQPNDVYVIANAGASIQTILDEADTTGAATFYNGDDVVRLANISTNTILDVIGVLGDRPSNGWAVGSGTTKDNTLVRKSNVNEGQTDWAIGATQWDVYDRDFTDSLGSHSIQNCDVQTNPIVLALSAGNASIAESAGSYTLMINLSNITENLSFDIGLDAANTTADAAEYSISGLGNVSIDGPADDRTIEVIITVTDDMEVESNETVAISISNVMPASTNVSQDAFVLTIANDDEVLMNPCAEVFFSEYIEGSGSNKAIEVFNPSDAAIDMSGYKINLYGNGASTPNAERSFAFPTGFMLGAGEVYVISSDNSDSVILAQADTNSSVTFFNGNDALELIDTVNNEVYDIIGVIGENPGSSWAVGMGSTKEFTLVRKPDVHEGNTVWSASVPTWDVYPQDSFTFLGSHTMTPCENEACEGVTITITADVTDETTLGEADGEVDITVSGGTMPYTYSWNTNETSEDLDGLTGGAYTVTVTDSNGCTGMNTFNVKNGVDPCANVNIQLSFAVTDESTSGANDGAINLTVSGGQSPYTYAWVSGQDTEDIDNLQPNDYSVTVKDANDCEATGSATVAAGTVGIEDIQGLRALNIFPNPTNDVINVQLQLENNANVRLEIADVLGRTVYTTQTESVDVKSYTISTAAAGLQAGVYFIRLNVNDNFAVKTFVVE